MAENVYHAWCPEEWRHWYRWEGSGRRAGAGLEMVARPDYAGLTGLGKDSGLIQMVMGSI